jgi:hypothetical protein
MTGVTTEVVVKVGVGAKLLATWAAGTFKAWGRLATGGIEAAGLFVRIKLTGVGTGNITAPELTKGAEFTVQVMTFPEAAWGTWFTVIVPRLVLLLT